MTLVERIKQFGKIVLVAGTLAAIAGCSVGHSYLQYDGKIGEEDVSFTEENFAMFADDNILVVEKPDGTQIKYVDSVRDDLKIEYVEITVDGVTQRYRPNDPVGDPIVEKAQAQFTDYLMQIEELRKAEGLENLDL